MSLSFSANEGFFKLLVATYIECIAHVLLIDLDAGVALVTQLFMFVPNLFLIGHVILLKLGALPFLLFILSLPKTDFIVTDLIIGE